jgi:hypothetical protein
MPDILVNGTRMAVLWDEQARPWFGCPACGRRCKHVYLDQFACRICCRLDYASRHFHRTVPGVHRLRRLRRQIDVDWHPFAPIPKRPEHHVRYHLIVARIRAEEAGLVEHLVGIVHDLRRRIRVRKAKGKW